MKKIIKLTESDLVRIVKRVIREQKAAPYLESYSSIGEKSYPELGILSNPSYGWGQIAFTSNYIMDNNNIRKQTQLNYYCDNKSMVNDNSDPIALNRIYSIKDTPVNASQIQTKLDGFCQMATQMGLDKRYQM